MSKEPIVTVAEKFMINRTVFLVSIGAAFVIGVVAGALIF